MTQRRYRVFLLCSVIAAFMQSAATADAQTVVWGSGNPDIDIRAVQAAVDQGGRVVLKGHFSFDMPPTIPHPLEGFQPATVLVSKAVAIIGTRDEDGEMTSIEAGTIPFLVQAQGARVTIQGLRFVRPKLTAIWVFAVRGLVIASCRIEGVEVVPPNAGIGIYINTSGPPPTPAQPGRPDNVSGILSIVNNDLDIGGTADDLILGITVFSVGTSEAEVELDVSGNNIRNTTERAINLYQVGGRAYIEGNVLTTSTTAGPAGGLAPDVIHVVGSGSYLIAHNSLDSRWATGAGIRLHSQFVGWPIARAFVVDNDVTMSAPEGTVFGTNSAAIDIVGSAQGNAVLNNRIRGRARAALSVAGQGTGLPDGNALISNDHDDFESSLADVFVGAGVTNTIVIGRIGTIEDNGTGTIIVPLPEALTNHPLKR